MEGPLKNPYMGRIKTRLVKRKTKELLREHGEKFAADFSQNKQVVSSLMEIPSKKLRNIMAGYITRLKRKEQ